MALIDKETIRAEIERRFWDYGTPLHDEEVTKKVDEILDILDTLPEQPMIWSKDDYHWEGLKELLRDYQKTIDRQHNNMAYESVGLYIDWIDSLFEQPVKNPCSFYSEGYGCEISPMKNCIGCEHNRWGWGTKVAKKQPVTTITKSNALFDKCVENCDPAVMKEVSDNVDKMLASEELEKKIKRMKDWWEHNVGKTMPGFENIAHHFAEWQKAKMLEGAEECEVVDFSSYLPRPQVDIRLDPGKYHSGDKVRVIIIKEDEK